jgi:plastocyanin
MRLLSCVLCCALCVTFTRAEDAKPAAPAQPAAGQWATVKGRVVLPEKKDIPKRAALAVTQDKNHCLKDGDILDESVIVNAKNRGIKNVVVWLRPLDKQAKEFEANEIHPDDAKRKPVEVVITQPCCMFVNRVTCARPGDTLVVKNPAPVPHNFFWSSANNGEYNVTIPKMEKWVMKDANATEPQKFVAEPGPVQYKCTIHPWMSGYVRIFDHPYFAVTDADGNFEIKNAPVGKFRIVFWHENGLRGKAEGRFGEEIEIKGPVMVMKPTDFDVTPK